MTEVLWPPDLVPSLQMWTTIGNAATFNSPFSGISKTYGRPGVRMGCSITLPPVKGENRARMLAVLRALKDRGNAIWVPDFSTTLETGLPVRGSFAATELLVNNGFSSGTAGWSAAASSISVSDRALRIKSDKSLGATAFGAYQSGLSVTQYAPYAVRGFVAALSRSGMSNGSFFENVTNYSTDKAGLVVQSGVVVGTTLGSTLYPGSIFDTAGTVAVAGDYAEVSWTSLARCAVVDNGPNALLYSDQTDNAAWTKNDCTVSANVSTAPDGTATGDAVVENTTGTSQPSISQSFTVTSAAQDIFMCGAFRASRPYVHLALAADTEYAEAWFNISTGAVGSTGAGTWTNVRAFIVPLGADWYYCALIARKTSADTSINAVAYSATSDTGGSYSTTNGSTAFNAWRLCAGSSSVPPRLSQTTTTATAGASQTGGRLYVKGLPASTSGLLKAGDMVQIGGQINQLTAPLDSNAAGLGVMICGNPWRSPADNAPVIVNTPMCKMQLAADTIDIETGPGQFSPFTLELVEVIE